jgi:hypothetical protein
VFLSPSITPTGNRAPEQRDELAQFQSLEFHPNHMRQDRPQDT